MSFCCHSSLTSMTSAALPISFAAFRYSFACLISFAVYSGISVFMMFQKYSLSGTRPFGKWSGKYLMKALSFCIWGQKLMTDSSSYLGTLIHLTSLSSNNCFFSVRTSLRKSLFILYLKFQIEEEKLTYILEAGKVVAAPWSTLWSHSWSWTCQTVHVDWGYVSLSTLPTLVAIITLPF